MQAVTLYGPNPNYYDSYGVLIANTALQLQEKGIYPVVRTHTGFAGHPSQPPEVLRITTSVPIPTAGGIVFGYPNEYKRNSALLHSGPRVAVTTFESTQLPDGWVEALNECAAVLTPSTWSKKLLEDSGVAVPVIHNPEGVDPVYEYAERPEIDLHPADQDECDPLVEMGLRPRSQTPWLGKRPFTFLLIADRSIRRNVELSIAAFNIAFGFTEARLIIKTRKGVGIPQINNPNIDVLEEDLSIEDMARLYQACDVMIAASSGEGWGRMPREFAATGGLALVTNWSGLADDLEEWGIPFNDFEMGPAWVGHPRHEGLGEWANPNAFKLAQSLQRLSQIPVAERNARGKKFSQAIRRMYRWEDYADRIWDAYQEAVGNQNITVKVPGLFSS